MEALSPCQVSLFLGGSDLLGGEIRKGPNTGLYELKKSPMNEHRAFKMALNYFIS